MEWWLLVVGLAVAIVLVALRLFLTTARRGPDRYRADDHPFPAASAPPRSRGRRPSGRPPRSAAPPPPAEPPPPSPAQPYSAPPPSAPVEAAPPSGGEGLAAFDYLPVPADGAPSGQRHANAWLSDPDTWLPFSIGQPLPLGAAVELWLSIGPRHPYDQRDEPVPFPDHLLPEEDVVLDVVVSSPHLRVEPRDPRPTFRLPAHGGEAVAGDGSTTLRFLLHIPEERRPARVRIGYFFRDALVQSQVVDIGADGHQITTDYTASADLRGLHRIPDRPRVSVVANAGPGGGHQVTVRAPGAGGGQAVALEVDPEQLGDPLDRLRRAISNEEHRPTTTARSRDQLVADLRRLAGPGAELYEKFFVQARTLLWELHDTVDPVVHIARPSTSTFTLPWAFLYDFPLPDRSVDALARVPVCERVLEWERGAPLVEAGWRRCPNEGLPSHRAPILCPFGFWGFRHRYEVLTSRDDVVPGVAVEEGASLVALLTTRGVRPDDVAAHLERLREALAPVAGTLALGTAERLADAQVRLGADVPVVYLLCHGERDASRPADTWLSIGKDERFTPSQFLAWLRQWEMAGSRYWSRIRPLVFVNACHSVEVRPQTMLSWVEAFVGGGRAAGVVGTEATVHQQLAMDFANAFFQALGQAATVGDALHVARMRFLAEGNLFGLLYAPYCWADLRLAPAAA